MGFRGLLAAVAALIAAPAAAADPGWLPHPANATWTYQWTDSKYAPTPTSEQVTVKSQTAAGFVLAWTTDGLSNPDGAISSSGTMSFQSNEQGLAATDWSSTPPPTSFPVLCASAASCPNSLAGTLYDLIWGSRNPVLVEPLLKGSSWASTGGGANDVSSTSTYIGVQQITVPAFPHAVPAAGVRTQVTQAGALGDPYGSGTRTVWWVYGVGPVKITFQHAGGAAAPVTTSVLQSTNQTPLAPPSDLDWFPFAKGKSLTYSWTNTKHLTKPEVEKFTVDTIVNETARFSVASVSGPIKVKGSYGFSKGTAGLTNLWGQTSSATLLKFPPLGPHGAGAAKRNHFVTPFDLLTFGFNPLLPPDPSHTQTWSSSPTSSDFETYAVTGTSRVLGEQKVAVPAGTFEAVAIRTTMKQPGFPYGSGTRTAWFAPGKGLVKLVFDHGDGSVSTVVLVR